MSNKKVSAGRRGGLATLARHGVEHFKKIGARGATVFHSRYKLVPVGQDDFAIVNRSTGEVKNFLSGSIFK